MEKQKIHKMSVVLIIGIFLVFMNYQCSKKSTGPIINPPVASFSYSINLREVQFTDQSTDQDGEITEWHWSFGDGSVSEVQNPIHSYVSIGTFEVCLIVTDNDGATGSYLDTVDIINSTPIAAFVCSTSGCTVEFTDESVDKDGEIVIWEWDFGDDSLSSIQNPSHQYTVAGSYEVVLVVADNDGAKDTIFQNIALYCDYTIYNDLGDRDEGEIWIWSGEDWGGPEALFDPSNTEEDAPEGYTCFKTKSGPNWGNKKNYAGWGVFLIKPSDHIVDLSAYTYLKFWVKTIENLKVEIQHYSRNGSKFKVYITDYGWGGDSTWQEINIPVDAFSWVNVGKIFCPFMITVEQGDKVFYVDDVRWVN
jgi:hypothetical protein